MIANSAHHYFVVACCALSCAAGCVACRDCRDQVSQRIQTQLAWRDYDADGAFHLLSDYSPDFRGGWKTGYYRVLSTGDGRLPVLPPRKYWAPGICRGSDDCGQQEWRNGYIAGARAAQCGHHRVLVRPFLPPRGTCSVHTSDCCVAGSAAPTVSIRLLGIVPVEAAPVDEKPGLIGPPQVDHATETFPPPQDVPTELVPRQQ